MDLDFLDLEEFSQDISPAEPPSSAPAVDRLAVDHHVADRHDQPENRRKYLFILFIIFKWI